LSPEKLDLLLRVLDKIRVAAVEGAAELGIKSEILAPFFSRPQPPADWLLELSKVAQIRNPGLMNFMAENMPQPAGHVRSADRSDVRQPRKRVELPTDFKTTPIGGGETVTKGKRGKQKAA
jgi:hypothetical protein